MRPTKVDYAAWLHQDIAVRRGRYPLPAVPPSLAVLTTVYPKTNAALLIELSRSLLDQCVAFSQWVIVAHGALPAELDQVLARIATSKDVHVARVAEDLSIMRAMKRAFDLATSDYVVPVDSDDLLTVDALHILASAIASAPSADLLYSDEDLLVEGQPQSPYGRPDFDPVLNDETSYIWHATAIRRAMGLRLGLYTDELATWTHDWDTAQRMQRAGAHIMHVPEVLYHWRQHPISLSNSGAGNTEQMKSVRHVLQCRIARAKHPEQFEVREVRFDRGGALRELFIARIADELPEFRVISERTTEQGGAFLLGRISDGALAPGETFGSLQAAIDAAEAAGDGLLAVIEGDVRVDSWPDLQIEATRLFDLHDSLVGIGGRLIGDDGVAIDSCAVAMPNGGLVWQHVGMKEHDPGPYALALKAHSVAALMPGLAIFRSGFIASGDFQLPLNACIRDLVNAAGRVATDGGSLLAYSPVVVGRASRAQTKMSEPEWRAHPRRGLAGAWFHRQLHD